MSEIFWIMVGNLHILGVYYWDEASSSSYI